MTDTEPTVLNPQRVKTLQSALTTNREELFQLLLTLEMEEIDDQEQEIWSMLSAEDNSTDAREKSKYHDLALGETIESEIESEPGLQSEPIAVAESETEPAVAEPDGPRELSSFFEQLTKSEARDDIASCLISYLGQEFSAGGILMVKGDQATGWQATIGGKPVADFDHFHTTLDQPSVLLTVAQTKSYYLGPIAETVQNIMLVDNFGPDLPETVLLVPLLLRGRLVSILYVQDKVSLISEKLAELQSMVSKGSVALEILVLKNKIFMS